MPFEGNGPTRRLFCLAAPYLLFVHGVSAGFLTFNWAWPSAARPLCWPSNDLWKSLFLMWFSEFYFRHILVLFSFSFFAPAPIPPSTSCLFVYCCPNFCVFDRLVPCALVLAYHLCLSYFFFLFPVLSPPLPLVSSPPFHFLVSALRFSALSDIYPEVSQKNAKSFLYSVLCMDSVV